MWFEKLVGFREENPEQVRSNLEIHGSTLLSKANGAEFTFGKLEVPMVEELRSRSALLETHGATIQVSEVVGNIQTFHKESVHNGAIFQVASQFNLLEMIAPEITPERGVGIYENDHTQGPACAIACGAGTIYRNYFANVRGGIGQSANRQIDCLRDLGAELGNEDHTLWKMTNGYALATTEGLKYITKQIQAKSEQEYETLKGKLRIGVQWETEVTISDNKNLVTQAYCSALPVAYSAIAPEHWSSFARLILEATLCVALLNAKRTGNKDVFLTLLGGGAFGNKSEWIFDAMKKAIDKFSDTPLNVKIVSYGSSSAKVREFVASISGG